jgi:hypothetical protein
MNPMLRPRKLPLFLICFILLAPFSSAQNLIQYRDFRFGMSVGAVEKQTQEEPGSAKTVQAVPDLLQTLQWYRQGYFSSSQATDPVRSIRFDFYKDQLFKIVATYGTRELAGMTVSDLIDGISKVYGFPSMPDESIVVSSFAGYEDRQKVLARWENVEFAYNLFRSSYAGEFGLVAFSKRLDDMATLSIHEGQRLEALAAPQREIDRQKKDAEERRALDEKARLVNGPNFIP